MARDLGDRTERRRKAESIAETVEQQQSYSTNRCSNNPPCFRPQPSLACPRNASLFRQTVVESTASCQDRSRRFHAAFHWSAAILISCAIATVPFPSPHLAHPPGWDTLEAWKTDMKPRGTRCSVLASPSFYPVVEFIPLNWTVRTHS
jgi:hypothetical protein